jgi:SAM-dependent methyltransferase
LVFNKDYFEKIFKKGDPWGYATSEYEKVKYIRQIEAINKHISRPEKILEIGCAEGLFTKLLASTFPESDIVSLDISTVAVERAKCNCTSYANITFIEANILDYWRRGGLQKNTYDMIVQSESLFFLFPSLCVRMDMAQYFKDIVAALKETGIFVTAHGLSFVTRPVMDIYYTVLKHVSVPLHSAKYKEWNEFRNKYFDYDIRIFGTK